MNITLALDIATNTGWAKRYDDASVKSGTVNFKPQPGENDSMRLERFGQWVLTQIQSGISTIVYEYVQFTPKHQAGAILNEMRGVLKYLSAIHGVKTVGIPVSTIKKAVSGKGTADKKRIIAIMRATYKDQDIRDDNQADALAVLWCGCERLGLSRPKNGEELL